MTRTPARGQVLPLDESSLLATLAHPALAQRCAQLYAAGWTLASIGQSLTPKRPRSTVRVWITNLPANSPTPTVQALLPDVPTPAPSKQQQQEARAASRQTSPGITPTDAAEIARLAPLARQYRARVSSSSTPALANQALTELTSHLHSQGVTVRELATAAGVTYRAMARRLGKTNTVS